VDQFTCVVLPVRNGQEILRARVVDLIDVVSEIAGEFEIRIIDDASTDATFEIASELAIEYPQISVDRLCSRQGMVRAAETAVHESAADIFFVCDIGKPVSHASLMSLWEMQADEEVVVASSRPSDSIQLQDRLDTSHGIRMIRRADVPTRTRNTKRREVQHATHADLGRTGIAITDPAYIQYVYDAIDVID
jgi:glycosyltransferase involved in cell wall biosynthesis